MFKHPLFMFTDDGGQKIYTISRQMDGYVYFYQRNAAGEKLRYSKNAGIIESLDANTCKWKVEDAYIYNVEIQSG